MLRKKLYTQILSIFFALLIFTAACGRTGRPNESRPDEGGTSGLSAESVTLSESVPVTEADAVAFPKTCKPAFFSFSGGTGKVTITCPEVTIKSQTSNQISSQTSSQTSTQINGQISDGEKDKNRDKIAEAVLVFSSPHYEWVKSDGIEYLPDNTEESNRETSIFTIPVLLDEEMKISALTTAMSEPHEIEYTIFISLNEETQDSPNTDALENTDISEKTDAPEKADTPEETDAPEKADTPEETDALEKADAPEGTDAPEKADAPEGTDTPEKTGALEKSETSILPDSEDEEIYDREKPESHTAPEIPGLTFVSEKELAYAEAFAVYNYRAAESGIAQDAVSNNTPGGVTIDSAGDTSGNITTDAASDSSTDGLFRLIDVYGNGGARYLLVPEGAKIPKELQKALQQEQQKALQQEQQKTPQKEQQKALQQEQQKALQQEQQETLRGEKDSPANININKNTDSSAIIGKITVLQAPLDNLYVAATSSMALFDAAGAISQVKLTGTDAKGWYIDAPRQALENGSMVYAGKYSAPDYELLTVSGCDLAVESMMILHTPEVKEKLEELGIPVFIDTSSSETHPMGRTEWVRLYGILTGHEKEADEFFEKQIEIFAESDSYTDTGKTTAFFSITSNGNVIVRAADDYIPKMISLAGGHYIFTDLTKGTGNSASVRLSMEDFYNTAKDADYLIYNATIEKPVGSIRELCSKFALLSEFKAVQEGHVWQVRSSLYQSPDIAARMITDLRRMLTEQNGTEMTFLEPVSN